MSIEKDILSRIESIERGELLFPSDFNDLGSSEAVRISLFRLEQAGEIERIAQGIYVRPKESRLVGKIIPTAEEVAEAIAKRDHIRIVPTGIYALNTLGLSTQVPMNVVYLTDGSPREIKLGRRSVRFKKTTPKNLMAKGSKSRLVIQALKEIGNGHVTKEEEGKIVEVLKKENKQYLLHDIALAPVWIQKIMKKAVENDGK